MTKKICAVLILAFTCITMAYAWKYANCTRTIQNVDGVLKAWNDASASGSNNGLVNGVASAHADVSGNNHVGHDTQHFSANYVSVGASDSGSYTASGLAYFATSGYDSNGNYQYISAQDSN